MTVTDPAAVIEALEQAERVAVVLHELPDGDTTGSGLGLKGLLQERGKHVDVLAPDAILPPYLFLPGALGVRSWDAIEPGERPWDVAVTVDCGDAARCFGTDRLRELAPLLINIDHHQTNRCFGDINWVDPHRVAVGEMILALADSWGHPVSRAVATCLYVSLVMDTEGLRFGFQDETVLLLAARLVKAGGLDPDAISRKLWEQRSLASVHLLGWALSHVQCLPGGRVAWIAMPAHVLRDVGAVPYETEGLVNYLRALKGVQLAAFLREEEDGSGTRVSLRSRLPWEASRVAAAMGGGGHQLMAGARVAGAASEAVRMMLRALEDLYGETIPWKDLQQF
jgi:phosphoesterase RecJ-like protein